MKVENDRKITLTPEQIDKLPGRYVHKKTHLPYEVAKELINKLAPHVVSANKYQKWRKETKAYYMPSNPNRIYKNFSWSDFLESEPQVDPYNRFIANRKRREKYLPMWEAIRWAQQFCRQNGIKTKREWDEWNKNGNELPEFIPKDPYGIYKNDGFPGFPTWCGVNVEVIQEASKQIIPVLTLLHPVKVAQNVLQTVSWPKGIGDLREKWRTQSDFDRILGCWEYERELMPEVERILLENGFSDGERWTIPNVNQLTWELNSILKIIRL